MIESYALEDQKLCFGGSKAMLWISVPAAVREPF